MFYLKEIYERLINVLNNPKSNYCSRINSLECFKLIAKKLKNIDDEILGYHLTEIIFTLQNACKDRVHKVQLAANSAIKDWREIEEIYEKNKKKGKYDRQKNLSDKEANLFKIQKENNFEGNNYCKEDYGNVNVNYNNYNNNKEVFENKKGKMNKLNVLRNLSKLNKQDSNNSNRINTEEDDFLKQRRNKNTRNINEFFKMDDLKDKNNFKKSENFKDETYKKGIGNVLKLSNLLRNFQKENKNNILNDLRSQSNPRAASKISPPKNKLLESVANYLRISRSGEKENSENKNRYNKYKFDLNQQRKYEKGLVTDLNWYKKDTSPEFNKYNKHLNLSGEELLDYQFLSNVDFQEKKNDYENFVYENEAEKNIEIYENTKKLYKIKDDVNLKINSNNNFNNNEIKEKTGNENKENKIIQSNYATINTMKTDINNIFFSFMHNLETFNTSINTKLNAFEFKIKKNRKLIKDFLKQKKQSLEPSAIEAAKSKQKESSISSDKKNESQNKNEENNNNNKNYEIEIDKINKKQYQNKFVGDSKKSVKEANNESNKIHEINNNNSFSEHSQNENLTINKKEEEFQIKESSNSYSAAQAELIKKLKKEVEFYKRNSQAQDIFKNINYTVVEKQNQSEHSSVKFWKGVLDLTDQKEFNSAYSKVLESEDDLYLLRLLCITGPVLNSLKLDICKKLIMRTNLIYRSHQIEFILVDLINNSHKHYIFNLLTKNEQNEILETLFQISGIKSSVVIAKIAADLYYNITINFNNR